MAITFGRSQMTISYFVRAYKDAIAKYADIPWEVLVEAGRAVRCVSLFLLFRRDS